MLIAHGMLGEKICARCGVETTLTIDHFIPKSNIGRMPVNTNINYVGLCQKCNQEKADKYVLPTWYEYLSPEQQGSLTRIMRYARSSVLASDADGQIKEYVKNL